MNPFYRTTVLTILCAAALEAGVGPATGQTTNNIAITNYSFEAPAVANGSYDYNALPTGWSSSGVAGAVVARVNPGPSDGRPYGDSPAGMDGNNYCQIYAYQTGGTGIAYQDLGSANKYLAGVTYTLTAAFGEESGSFATGSALVFYNSSLTAIASNVISSANLISGAFTNFSVTCTGTGNEGGNGDIVVGFFTPSSAGSAFFDFDNVRLTAVYPPGIFITNPPASQAAFAGYAVSFTVGVTGTSPFGYQWQVNTGTGFTNLMDGGQISGSQSNVLTIANVTPNWAQNYQVIVTNLNGAVTSSPPANLTVASIPYAASNPSPTNLQFNFTGNLLTLAWPPNHLGWKLQAQTNSISVGLGTNWVTIPGTEFVTATNLNLVPTNSAVFYRLLNQSNPPSITLSPGANIPAAMNQISALGGGTVYLNAGTYNIASSLAPPSNITLSGAGAGSTILLGPSYGYTFPLISVSSDSVFNLTIQNLTINGNIAQSWANNTNNPYVNQAGISFFCPTFLASGNFTVANVEVLNCSVGMSGADINGLTVSNCAVHDSGMWIRAGLWQHDLYFNACSFVNLTQSRFYNSWGGVGIHLDSTTGSGSNWTVQNCICTNNASLGINIQNTAANVTVINSYLANNGYATNSAGNQYAWDGLGYSSAGGGLIAGNTFVNNKGYGLRVFAGSGSVTNNTATGNGVGNYWISGSWTQSGNQ